MASEAKTLQPITRVASIYCRINHELDLLNRHAIVLQRGKILLNSRWERMSPEGRRIWKTKVSERGTKCCEEKETRDETKYHVTHLMWTVAYWYMVTETEVKVNCRAKPKCYRLLLI